MFTKKQIDPNLAKALDKAYAKLLKPDITDEDFGKNVDQVVKLYKLADENTAPRVSPDTLAMIAANLTGIVLILKHEHVNVIASKAFSLIPKLK